MYSGTAMETLAAQQQKPLQHSKGIFAAQQWKPLRHSKGIFAAQQWQPLQFSKATALAMLQYVQLIAAPTCEWWRKLARKRC